MRVVGEVTWEIEGGFKWVRVIEEGKERHRVQSVLYEIYANLPKKMCIWRKMSRNPLFLRPEA